MRVEAINNYNQALGMKFKLSEQTIKSIEQTTGLSYYELTHLSSRETSALMKERGTLKEENPIKKWLKNIYRSFGERSGLLAKDYTRDGFLFTSDD